MLNTNCSLVQIFTCDLIIFKDSRKSMCTGIATIVSSDHRVYAVMSEVRPNCSKHVLLTTLSVHFWTTYCFFIQLVLFQVQPKGHDVKLQQTHGLTRELNTLSIYTKKYIPEPNLMVFILRLISSSVWSMP